MLGLGNDQDNIARATATARTGAVRTAGLLVCTVGGGEHAFVSIAWGVERPISPGVFARLLAIAVDRGSESIREKAPDLRKAPARHAFFSASDWLCHAGKLCPLCRERAALRPLLDGLTLEEAFADDGRKKSA